MQRMRRTILRYMAFSLYGAVRFYAMDVARA